MTSKSRCCSAALAAVIALAVAAPVAAQSDSTARSEEYERHFVRGRKLFEASRYTEARAAFEAAHAEYPEPLLLFNIGSTYRRQNDLATALVYYRRFLQQAPPDDSYRPLAEKVIAEITAELAEADRATRDREPPADDAGETRAIEAAPETDRNPLPPSSLGDAPADTTPAPGRSLRIAGIASTTVGALATGIAIHQALRARDIEAELEAAPQFDPALYDDGQDAERRAIIFGTGGGLLITTGVILYVAGWLRADDEPSVSASITADSATLFVTGRF